MVQNGIDHAVYTTKINPAARPLSFATMLLIRDGEAAVERNVTRAEAARRKRDLATWFESEASESGSSQELNPDLIKIPRDGRRLRASVQLLSFRCCFARGPPRI